MSALFGPGGNSREFYDSGYKSTKQAIKWIHDYGLDAYEYQAGNGVTGGETTFREIGEEARKYGIKISLHAPYFISLANDDELIRKNSIRHLADSMRAADWIGADTVVVHPGGVGKNSRVDALNNAKASIEAALEKVNTHGISIGLETMGKIGQLGTIDEIMELCKIDSCLQPVVDFGHLYARSIGTQLLSEDDYRRVFDVLGDYAQNLHCHFSRIEYTKGGEKKHLTFADTDYGPDFEPLLNIIAENKLSPRVICESDETMAADSLTMKKYYNQIIYDFN